MDFIAAPEAVFLKFLKMFGVEDERRDIIERRVILSPIKKSLVIDYYPRVAKVSVEYFLISSLLQASTIFFTMLATGLYIFLYSSSTEATGLPLLL